MKFKAYFYSINYLVFFCCVFFFFLIKTFCVCQAWSQALGCSECTDPPPRVLWSNHEGWQVLLEVYNGSKQEVLPEVQKLSSWKLFFVVGALKMSRGLPDSELWGGHSKQLNNLVIRVNHLVHSLPQCAITSICHPSGHSFIHCSSASKESACNVGDLGLIPWLGRSHGEGKGYPLQYSGLENSMDSIGHGAAKRH